ncbi:hypothetical protein MRB53_012423 [Persea americana]|uniref:Uncharacterized protein n=1 Tax=Persea americana TaxID=3435 RepID=A0ACC2LXB1_PERAE|nr:hypothetical protein MRB53_012423 [Persea americana]
MLLHVPPDTLNSELPCCFSPPLHYSVIIVTTTPINGEPLPDDNGLAAKCDRLDMAYPIEKLTFHQGIWELEDPLILAHVKKNYSINVVVTVLEPDIKDAGERPSHAGNLKEKLPSTFLLQV